MKHLKMNLVDDAVLVLVHDAKSLLELIDGLLVELSGLRRRSLLGLLLGGLRLKSEKISKKKRNFASFNQFSPKFQRNRK